MAEQTPIPVPTWGDPGEAIETIWAALERLPEGALSDTERGHVNTAMAWLQEAIEEYPG